MKMMSKLKKKQICAALACGLLLGMGGEWSAAEAAGIAVIGHNDSVGLDEGVNNQYIEGYAHSQAGYSSYEGIASGANYTITGGDWYSKRFYGGHKAADILENNYIGVTGGTFSGGICGAYLDTGATGITRNNTVEITGGTFSGRMSVTGGNAYKGASLNNTVIMSGIGRSENSENPFSGSSITGGSSEKNTASGNRVIISNSEISNAVIQGGTTGTIEAKAYGNRVELVNCKYNITSFNAFSSFAIIGGRGNSKVEAGVVTERSSVYDNTVVLGGGNSLQADVCLSTVTEGSSIDRDYKASEGSNGTLEVRGTNKILCYEDTWGGDTEYYCGNVYAHNATVKFYLTPDLYTDSTKVMLAAQKTVNFNNSQIQICVPDLVALKNAGEITLVTAGEVEGGEIEHKGTTITVPDPVLDVRLSPRYYSGEDGKAIKLTITGNSMTLGAKEDAKSPVETQAAGVSLVNLGADMVADRSMSSAAAAVAAERAGGSSSTLVPFAGVNGGSLRIESGSHVDMNSWNIAVGFAKEVENKKGKLMFGPIVEYGRGSYDSYLDNGTHADGNSSFYGAGFIAKQTYKNDRYLEGSLRVGRMKNEYNRVAGGIDSGYDNSAAYYGAHIGVGKIVKLNEKDTVDYYGKLFYSHQNGSTATLRSGHVYDFDAVDSFRTRLGMRYNRKLADGNLYAGLAWQHEFDSRCDATVRFVGLSTSAPAPSMRGDSGIIELGWKATAWKNVTVDLNMNGWVGKQRGISGGASLQWSF